VAWAIGLSLLIANGCSEREELTLDAGVSPFYPANPVSPSSSGDSVAVHDQSARDPAARGITEARTVATSSSAAGSEAPIDPGDIERQLRIALRAVQKGDSARSTHILDRILAVEPFNREALSGRATIALGQFEKAATPSERAAALETAGALVRNLHRVYERSSKRENNLFGRVLYAQAKIEAGQKHEERALALLKEAYDGGFNPFDEVEKDQSMVAIRSSPAYSALLRAIDLANAVLARGRMKDRLERPLQIPFDFTLPDLDGKPVALAQLKGKVVLVDLWGTWCKPCREAIPGLIELYRKHRRRGFEIVGIDYEQDAPDPEAARLFVKQFATEMGIPYPCVIGDDITLGQIPNFHGFPTSLVLDKSGKVRLLVTQNSEGTLRELDDTIEVLLAEPVLKSATTDAPAKPR
jgi:thiol-disulfide isomerase/thioredoxin